MGTKTCRRCGIEKDISEFYIHPKMKDGHLNACKLCVRKRVKDYQQTDAGRATQSRRNQKPERKAHIRATAKKWAAKYRDRRRAQSILAHALLRGSITRPEKCDECPNTKHISAHHEDYSRPLDVQWLCPKCHGKRNPHYKETIE